MGINNLLTGSVCFSAYSRFNSSTLSYFTLWKTLLTTFLSLLHTQFLSWYSHINFCTIPLQVEEECGSIPMVLVQNKIDLIDQALVKV